MKMDSRIEEGRLHTRSTDAEKCVDILGARQLRFEQNLFELNLMLQEAVVKSEEMNNRTVEILNKNAKQIRELLEYNRDPRSQIEEDAVNALEAYLKNEGYEDFGSLDGKQKKVQRPDNSTLVQWGALLACTSPDGVRTLFLVETKSHVREHGVKSVYDRIRTTRDYLKDIERQVTPSETDALQYRQLCLIWSVYCGYKLQGVVSGSRSQ